MSVRALNVKVYLIRHAQSEENVLSLRQKTTVETFNQMLNDTARTPLTRWGQFQAQVMVGHLDGAAIEHIYTSPFDRAVQTAAAIGREFHLAPQVVYDLREILPSQLRDLSRKNNRTSLGRLLLRSYMDIMSPLGPGEKLPACLVRARRVWNYVSRGPYAEVAVVSHYGLLSLMLLNLRYSRTWRIVSRDLSNGGVSIVQTRRG